MVARAPKPTRERGTPRLPSLSTCPLFFGLSGPALRSIRAMGEVREFRRGELIVTQGQEASHLYVLMQGCVRVFMTDHDGNSITVRLFHPTSVFGEMEALTHTPHVEHAEVLRKAVVLTYTREQLEAMLDEHPTVTKALLFDVCARFRATALGEARAAMERVEQRLAALVLSYARVVGVPVEGGVQLVAELTQGDLAEGVGATRKSVGRTFRSWMQDGLIVRRGPAYVVADMRALVAIAGAERSGIDHRLTHRPSGAASRTARG